MDHYFSSLLYEAYVVCYSCKDVLRPLPIDVTSKLKCALYAENLGTVQIPGLHIL